MGFAWDGPWRWAWGAAAMIAGTALQLQMASLAPDGAVLAAVGTSALLAIGVWRLYRSPRRPSPSSGSVGSCWSFCALLPALAALGFGQAHLQAAWRLGESLPARLEGRDLSVTGVVTGLPRPGPNGTQFEFDVDRSTAGTDTDAADVPTHLSLLWPGAGDPDAWMPGPPPRLVAGDRWRLIVRLKRPHALQNPGVFDAELWLFERGIRATGTVRPAGQWLAASGSQPVDRLRQAARDAILVHMADPRAAGVLAALSVGDQAAIDRNAWDVFRITGVAHLMSISGLHVTMFAWLAAGAIGGLWRRWPAGLRRWPAPDVARWGGVLTALAYAAVAGWGVPAQRTVLMLACVAALRGGGRRWPWPLVAAAAAVAVSWLDPWALLQAGFWLSFVAVCLLMASEPVLGERGERGRWSWLRDAVRQQAVATVGLAPLTLVFFQQVSLVGFLANALAIPLVTLVITPLALLGLVGSAGWTLVAPVIAALMGSLEAMAAWPWAQWGAAQAPPWAAVLGLLGGAVMVMPLPPRLRLAGVGLALPLLLAQPERPAFGELQLLAADVGQGTAVLVRTREHLLVYDTGPRYGADSDAAGRVLLPLLRARGEDRVDRLVLSHRDTDHIGGAETLLKGVRVLDSLSSLEPGHPLMAQLPAHRRCEAGQTWAWDGVTFEVLHPRAEDHARSLRPNGLSCVIRVVDRAGPRILLTGDLEAPQEAELVERYREGGLQTPILLLPHHGSRTSSSPGFLQAVRPHTAVAQAAYRSRFGHPAPDVVARVQAAGVHLVRSDTCGAWRAATPAQTTPDGTADDAGRPTGRCERDQRRRYWHHPGLP